jgi:hypothetical protein
VDGNLHFPVPPTNTQTGSIKPSLHHFQICHFGRSLGIPVEKMRNVNKEGTIICVHKKIFK